jgi:hypothetical protein
MINRTSYSARTLQSIDDAAQSFAFLKPVSNRDARDGKTTQATFIVLIVAVFVTAIGNVGVAQEMSASHAKLYNELHADFRNDVAQLIKYCSDNKLTASANSLEAWNKPIHAEALKGVALPKKLMPEISLSLPPAERKWRVQFKQKRQDLGRRLYLLSRRLLNDGYATAAWGILREVTYFDSDHKQARLILGFEQYGDEWVTPYAARSLKAGKIWTEKFGWLRKDQVERYEKGMRFHRNRWITAARENVIRQDFKFAWAIETDHYLVKTNVSLEKGVELATALEDFHKYFRGTFAAFFNSPEQLAQLFDGRQRRKKSNRFEIHFFKSREEYIARLKKDNPRIGITNGIYMPDAKVAFFYNNPEVATLSTLYHEATHQILYELYAERRLIGDREHFWIIEGIACYMESFESKKNGFSIGSPDYIRFKAADYRLNKDAYYMPLSQFAMMGKNDFQSSQEISKNYSQASGLSHFFMHYENGKYRDALIKHLSLLYVPRKNRVRIAGLDQLTGVSNTKLDRQYKAYITALYDPK